jgi:hypothetical protein
MSAQDIEEYEYESVRGLPGRLPAGETLLWQGSPSWWLLARRATRIVPVAGYFVLLALWPVGSVLKAGGQWLPALRISGLLLLLGSVAIAILSLIAWASARAAIYSITSRRIVIRHGIALTMCLNIPLRQIEGVDLSSHADGSGELALSLAKGQRVGYLLNWPHVRPLHYTRPQPTLRALPDIAAVASILTQALAASGAIAAAVPSAVREPAVAMPGAHTSAAA